MKAVTKITFYDNRQEKFFGEGPCRLLRAVEETGSLNGAAFSLGMAYTKALKIIKNAEAALGFPLLIRVTGGRDGGGSTLTDPARVWLEKYENYRDECVRYNQNLYENCFHQQENRQAFFEDVGVVVMASGLGKRFGSNKLLAQFNGKPMILHTLEKLIPIFSNVIVVTRHIEVEKLCREQGIPVLVHDLPGRNDTIRLGMSYLLEGKDLSYMLFMPSDQPLLSEATIRELVVAGKLKKQKICRLSYDNIDGAPVLFSKSYFDELMHLPQGKGGKVVLDEHRNDIACIPARSDWELKDVDTPQDLEYIQKHMDE